jgi:hypothetical protein
MVLGGSNTQKHLQQPSQHRLYSTYIRIQGRSREIERSVGFLCWAKALFKSKYILNMHQKRIGISYLLCVYVQHIHIRMRIYSRLFSTQHAINTYGAQVTGLSTFFLLSTNKREFLLPPTSFDPIRNSLPVLCYLSLTSLFHFFLLEETYQDIEKV